MNCLIFGASHCRFLVEFVSAKAFVKFLLDIQFDALLYPEGLSFTVHLKIGRVRLVLTHLRRIVESCLLYVYFKIYTYNIYAGVGTKRHIP